MAVSQIENGDFGSPLGENDEVLVEEIEEELKEIWIEVKKFQYLASHFLFSATNPQNGQSPEENQRLTTQFIRAKDWAHALKELSFCKAKERYELWARTFDREIGMRNGFKLVASKT